MRIVDESIRTGIYIAASVYVMRIHPYTHYNSRRRGSFAAKNHTHALVPFGWKIFTGILWQRGRTSLPSQCSPQYGSLLKNFVVFPLYHLPSFLPSFLPSVSFRRRRHRRPSITRVKVISQLVLAQRPWSHIRYIPAQRSAVLSLGHTGLRSRVRHQQAAR